MNTSAAAVTMAASLAVSLVPAAAWTQGALPLSNTAQLQQLVVFDRQAKKVGNLEEPGISDHPSFSPDGTRVLARRRDVEGAPDGSGRLWIFDVSTGKGTAVTDYDGGQPLWWPDGRSILFVSWLRGVTGVFRTSAAGGGDAELVFPFSPADMYLSHVSADGKFLAFGSQKAIFVVPLTGSDPATRTAIEYLRGLYDVGAPKFSPDGRFIAYRSNESGRFEIYVRPFNASTGMAAERHWQVSKSIHGAAAGISWRNDGKELLFLDRVERETEDVRLMSAQVRLTPTFRVAAPKPFPRFREGSVSPDGHYLVATVSVPVTSSRK